jgi:hypothetical protein
MKIIALLLLLTLVFAIEIENGNARTTSSPVSPP